MGWWKVLSSDARAAIIAAVVGSIVVAVIGSIPRLRMYLMRLFCVRALERIEEARQQARQESLQGIRTRLGGPIDVDEDFQLPLSILAKKAGISLWRAKYAVRWDQRRKRYGFS